VSVDLGEIAPEEVAVQLYAEPRNGEAPFVSELSSNPSNAADILRHTRLSDGDRLVDCFTAINQAFQTIRNDPEATLFGFDQQGHVFIHQTTHDGIRQLWEQLLAAHAPIAGGPALTGFMPPHLGPSEDIAQHPPGSASVNF
jgi:hypothetical protein